MNESDLNEDDMIYDYDPKHIDDEDEDEEDLSEIGELGGMVEVLRKEVAF